VVAEGIETSEQLRALRALGCEHGQGYYFSRPVSADDATLTAAMGMPAAAAPAMHARLSATL
jgi:EAL domain-containing protein (putative c-di-GMP-specific phosphodiesterase class I)